MLSQIREKFAGGVAIAILAIIGVSFIFFGTNLDFAGNSYAAKVDGSEIGVAAFENAYRAQLEQYPQLPAEYRSQLRQGVLDALVGERLVDLYLADAGYQIGDAQLEAAIQQIPEFHVDGKFDLEKAESLLQEVGYSTAQFKNAHRQQLRQQQIQRAIGGTALVTPSEYRRFLNLYAEQRLVSLASFDTAAFGAGITVSDEEIQAYYDSNNSLYLLPETASIEYIELNRADVAENIEIPEAVLNEYYLDSQSRFLQDEQRQARHILILFGDDEAAAEATARELLDRVNAGESFAELAAEYSMDGGTAAQGGDLGVLTRTQLPGELGSAIFSMAAGEVGGPIKSDFGFHVVRVDNILERGPLPLDQVRGELLTDLRQRETESLFRELERKASDALFENADMQFIASAVGLEVQTSDNVQRDNAGPFGNNQAAIDAIFDDAVLLDGHVSEVIEIDANRSAIFKVTAHSPASRQPLDDVREQIEAAIRNDKAADIVFDRATQLMQALDNGEDFAVAAAAAGASVSPATVVGRRNTELNQGLVARIFMSKKPADGTPVHGLVETGGGNATVFSLQAVFPGRPESIPQSERDAGKEQLALQAGGADYQAFLQYLRDRADIVINKDIVAASDLLQ